MTKKSDLAASLEKKLKAINITAKSEEEAREKLLKKLEKEGVEGMDGEDTETLIEMVESFTEDADEVEEVEDDVEDDASEDDEEDTDDSEEEDDDEEEKTDVKKGGIFDRFNRIEKALATSHFNNAKYIKALGVMVKASNDSLEKAINSLELANQKIDELNSINKAQEETISELSQRIESFGNGAPAPKSVRHAAPVERNFNKGNENDFEKGGNGNNGNIISISNKPAISNILDQATFAKGYDDEFSKACLNFEATGNLPANIISRLKTEYNISIVK